MPAPGRKDFIFSGVHAIAYKFYSKNALYQLIAGKQNVHNRLFFGSKVGPEAFLAFIFWKRGVSL
jgi:hypothetical protein